MKTTVIIEVNRIELEVSGHYTEGSIGDYENPPYYSDFEISSIRLVNYDDNLSDLFYNGIDYDDIVAKCLNTIEEAI